MSDAIYSMPVAVKSQDVNSANIPPTDWPLQASAGAANGPADAPMAQFSALKQ